MNKLSVINHGTPAKEFLVSNQQILRNGMSYLINAEKQNGTTAYNEE